MIPFSISNQAKTKTSQKEPIKKLLKCDNVKINSNLLENNTELEFEKDKVRKRYLLDNDWKFFKGNIDINSTITHDYIYDSSKSGRSKGPATDDYDDSKWSKISLPHDYAIEGEFNEKARPNFGYLERGEGWYRKQFKLENAHNGKQILIELDGLSADATVYFNGSILKRNFSGYNSFIVDLTERAHFGNNQNTLVIHTNAHKWEGWWYEGAGIYRHLWLTIKHPLHIEHNGVFVQTKKLANDSFDTAIQTTIENNTPKSQNFTIKSHIIAPDGSTIATKETSTELFAWAKKEISQNCNIAKPLLWDIDAPNLYALKSEIYLDGRKIDDSYTKYGYRTIRFDANKGFFLNDKPVKLKGTCNHQDHAGMGVAIPDSIQAYRIQLLKEMGSNSYRCSHNMPTPKVLDECDRQGILVMDENRNFECTEDALEQVKMMVKRDRNHPSIIMYSIFNEEPLQGTEEGRNIATKMIREIKNLDTTRPVLGAMNGGVMEPKGAAQVLDITGINYQLDVFDKFHKAYPKQPIVGSESASIFSTRGIYESDDSKHHKSSYDQEKAPWGETIRRVWQHTASRDYVMGSFLWTGFDYMGEPTPYEWPSVSTFFGMMDTCGFPKDAYYLCKAMWDTQPMIHILPHWNWEGKEGKPIKVMSHTNCEEAELFLNGKSLGKQKVDKFEQVFWNVPYEKGTLEMIGYKDGLQIAIDKVETAGPPKKLVIQPWRNHLFSDGCDAIPVNISAVDAEGRFVPLASDKVKFSIKGGAKLLGTGNGDPNGHESFKTNERSLFNGRCQAIIGSIGNDNVVINVEADGLEGCEYKLQMQKKSPPERI